MYNVLLFVPQAQIFGENTLPPCQLTHNLLKLARLTERNAQLNLSVLLAKVELCLGAFVSFIIFLYASYSLLGTHKRLEAHHLLVLQKTLVLFLTPTSCISNFLDLQYPIMWHLLWSSLTSSCEWYTNLMRAHIKIT